MKLALAQMKVIGGDPSGNVDRAVDRISTAANRLNADIVLLPEALDCGWTHSCAKEKAEEIPEGDAFQALAHAARQHSIYVCAGLIERKGDDLFNSAVLIDPHGQLLAHHRKINELDFARELYSVGTDICDPVSTPFGTIGIHICADGFAKDQWISRKLAERGADLILSPCAWAVPPDFSVEKDGPYGNIWRENYSPVAREYGMAIAGCSNVGTITDGAWKDHRCIGNSIVIGPDGSELLTGPFGQNEDALLSLDLPVT